MKTITFRLCLFFIYFTKIKLFVFNKVENLYNSYFSDINQLISDKKFDKNKKIKYMISEINDKSNEIYGKANFYEKILNIKILISNLNKVSYYIKNYKQKNIGT